MAKKVELPDNVYFDLLYLATRKFVLANNGWEKVEDVARRIFESRHPKVYPQNYPPKLNQNLPQWFAQSVYEREIWAFERLRFGYGVVFNSESSALSSEMCSSGVCSMPTPCLEQAFKLLGHMEKLRKSVAASRLIAESDVLFYNQKTIFDE